MTRAFLGEQALLASCLHGKLGAALQNKILAMDLLACMQSSFIKGSNCSQTAEKSVSKVLIWIRCICSDVATDVTHTHTHTHTQMHTHTHTHTHTHIVHDEYISHLQWIQDFTQLEQILGWGGVGLGALLWKLQDIAQFFGFRDQRPDSRAPNPLSLRLKFMRNQGPPCNQILDTLMRVCSSHILEKTIKS